MKSVLILGSTGMAGHMIFNYLDSLQNYMLYNISYRQKLNNSTIICDVTNQSELEDILFKLKADVVINCIGVLLKGSKEDTKNAIYINSYLPQFLSVKISEYGGKVIHLSTDCVFSGRKGGYIESDFRDAEDVYGRSKALGELNNKTDLTIRTSIIGPELKTIGEGLFNWIIRQNGQISGYSRVYWSGITTYELAKFIHFAISNNLTGLVHTTNNSKISKYDLIQLIIDIYSLKNLSLMENNEKIADKSLINSRGDFIYQFPNYKQMIEQQFHIDNK
jgi:dTDP-4-dehydrorhamnose reductase